MNKATLTLDDLIRVLNEIRYDRGGNTLIYKRPIKMGDDTTRLMPINSLNVTLDHDTGTYCITL